MPEWFHPQAREFGGRLRRQVTVRGVGAFNSWERLEKIISVEALEIQPDYQMAARFDKFAEMADGWYEGRGVAPDKTRLEIVAKRLIGHYPENLPLPSIFPTQEGNLLFEWNVPGHPSLDLDLKSLKGEFHAFEFLGQQLNQRPAWQIEDTFLEFEVTHGVVKSYDDPQRFSIRSGSGSGIF